MYLEHFGLDRPPFKITPDTSLFFEGSQRGAALGAVMYAIKNGEGIIKVVGEVGSGKTMLCRMLEVKLNGEVDIVYIANPSLSPDNILHVIAHELGLEVSTNTSKLEVMQKIQSYLLQKHADNRQVVMFVEEAQSMPVETLEEIRLLSNLETDQNKLLQMVLFGQPELDEKLSQNHIRQLKERITHSFYLEPFPPKDTFEYLNFRMRAVGYRGPDIFNHKTAGSVKKYSNGLTRRINILADKSLMASFSEGKHAVAVKHVKIAAKDSDFESIGDNRKLISGALLVTGLILAVWLGTQLSNVGSMLNTLSSQVLPQAEQPATRNVTQIDQSKIDKPLDNDAIIAEIAEKQPEMNIVEPIREIQLSKIEAVKEDIVVMSKKASTVLVQDIEIPVSNTENLVENRLMATDEWMSVVENDKYSIQLFLARVRNVGAVKEFLNDVPESLDFNKIYIYETLINNDPMYSVIYDEFESYSRAANVIKGLTDDFQINKPFIRRVSDFRRIKDLRKVSAVNKTETNVTLNNPVNR